MRWGQIAWICCFACGCAAPSVAPTSPAPTAVATPVTGELPSATPSPASSYREPGPTPLHLGERLYFGVHQSLAFDLRTRQVLWRHPPAAWAAWEGKLLNLGSAEPVNPLTGEAGQPLATDFEELFVSQDTVFLNGSGTLEARRQGRTLWKSKGFPSYLQDVQVLGDRFFVLNGGVRCHKLSDGSKVWEAYGGSSVLDKGRVYLVNGQGGVEARNASDGRVLWSHPKLKGTLGLGQGLLLVWDYTGQLRALEPATGKQRWDFMAKGSWTGPPACPRDVLVFGHSDGHLYAFDRGGKVRWRKPIGPPPGHPLAFDSDHLYLTDGLAEGERIRVFEAGTGKELWQRVSGRTEGRLLGDMLLWWDTSVAAINAFSLKENRSLWSVPLPDRPVAVEPGPVCRLSDGRQLELDSQDGSPRNSDSFQVVSQPKYTLLVSKAGRPLWKADLCEYEDGYGAKTFRGKPWVIVGGRLIFCRPKSVNAVELASGKPIWELEAKLPRHPSLDGKILYFVTGERSGAGGGQ